MEITNKTLSLLLIAAIVIGLGGTLLSLNKINEGLTGQVTSSGRVNLTINSSTSCTFLSNVDFGTGNRPGTATTIGTNLTNSLNFRDCTTDTNCTGMMLNNSGNVDVNVTFNSSVQGAAFMGGASAANSDFRYWTLNGTTTQTLQGCRNMTNKLGDVPTTPTLICQNLTYSAGNTIITIHYNITIRPDTPANAKLAYIMADCNQI
jgi:hypothetical protein